VIWQRKIFYTGQGILTNESVKIKVIAETEADDGLPGGPLTAVTILTA
jgi:hypothetical protein